MKTKRKALLAALEKIKEGETLGFFRWVFGIFFFSVLRRRSKRRVHKVSVLQCWIQTIAVSQRKKKKIIPKAVPIIQ